MSESKLVLVTARSSMFASRAYPAESERTMCYCGRGSEQIYLDCRVDAAQAAGVGAERGPVPFSQGVAVCA